MRYYFAPLEGLTDSVYRRLHHKYFPGIHRYYMPFISPTIHRSLTHKEDRELPMADSVDFVAVPQILTKVAEDFLWAAGQCADRGYTEVNLNVGCPSGTVVSKGKGAGMLRNPEDLDHFLEIIFRDCPIEITVKTRLGLDDPAEFPALLEVFNRYPIRELTIHPRVRKDFYSHPIREEWFRYALEHSKNPLCYNGNLCTRKQIDDVAKRYPQIQSVMIGRALIGEPSLLSPENATASQLEKFLAELTENYIEAFGSARNAMFRLKENWGFLHHRFIGSEKLWKRLRKTTDIHEFNSITAEIFHTLPLAPALQPDW